MYVLAHNIQAQFTNGELNITRKNREKSTERLSSGYKINRAADNAAGLAISEKTRKMIRGLHQGENNIQDGISLCQVADGALDEVTQVLQRARELSIQAYNGTNSDDDRQYIQDEIDSLFEEINRVRETAKFNEIPVLKGKKAVHLYTETQVTKVEKTIDFTMNTEKPDWLKINDGQTQPFTVIGEDGTPITVDVYKIEKHPEYNQKQVIEQNDVMYVPYLDSPPKEYMYYGPYQGPDHHAPSGNLAHWAGDVLVDVVDGNKIYNGPGADADWSPTLEDNPTAKIDFGGLIGATDSADSLYENLFSLIGTQLGFPCGTCRNQIEGVRFSANEFELTVNGFQQISGDVHVNGNASSAGVSSRFSEINLSKVSFQYKNKTYDGGYFEAIKELQQSHAKSSISDQQKQDAKELAAAIAKDLASNVLASLSGDMQHHFDRVTQFEDNGTKSDYALLVYDYRDMEKLTKENQYDGTASMINTQSTLDCTASYYEYYKEDISCIGKAQTSVHIIASGKVYDQIPIHLPDISLKSLNLTNYDITRYSFKVVYEEVSDAEKADYERAMDEWEQKCRDIDDDYNEKLQDYYQEHSIWEQNNTTKDVTYRQVPSIQQVLQTPPQYGYNKNGEWVMTADAVYTTKTTMVTIADIKITVTGNDTEPERPQKEPYPAKPQEPEPKMSMTYCYDPSDVKLLDDAISMVSAARSDIGATQNRLEHAYAYDCCAEENQQASESRIRDTDMSLELVNYSKQNILEQFGQSMLAQANHIQDGVLALLE